MAALGTGLLSSCGQPGAPQPPSLEMPRAVQDLSASRKGNQVTLHWTSPTRFTDGRIIRHAGETEICRATGTAPAAKCERIAALPTELAMPAQPRAQMSFQDRLSTQDNGTVMYGVEVQNKYGRSVGLSNQVPISTAPALPPPSRLSTSVNENGITLTWGPIAAPAFPDLRFQYQVSRRGENEPTFAVIGTAPIDHSQFLDQTFEWEKRYEYRIDVVTESAAGKVLVEGDDSEPVSAFAHDVFPPAQPQEVQAVFSGAGQKPFIDLTWAPDLEPDLAGYNIYRHEEGSAAVKLNQQPITAPSFRDEHVEAGKTYYYSVSAVDVRGNESARSAETSEQVP